MASEYDNLLDEALADFDEPALDASSEVKKTPANIAPETSEKTENEKKDAEVVNIIPPKGLSGLSLGKKGGARKSQPRKAPAAKASAPAPPDLSNLPPDVRQLAEDLFKLVEESDVSKGSEGKSQAELEAEALAQLSSLGLNFDLSQMNSGSEPDLFKSSAVQGLFNQTQKTVSESKTRGQKGGSKKGGKGSSAAMNPLEAIMGEMGGLLGGAEGLSLDGMDTPGGAMNMMVEHVMRNLLSKEVLYNPLRDIREKYPPWLAANKEKLSDVDYTRYEAQYTSVQKVCKQYEDAPDDFQKLVELMQEMQSHGDPPKDIVEDLTVGSGGAVPDLKSLGL